MADAAAPAPAPAPAPVDAAANPERALARYLEVATPQLKEHVDDCRGELDRRAKEKKQRLATATETLQEATKQLATGQADLVHWKKLVTARKDGAMRDPDEELDEDFDTGEEDGDQATQFFEDNDQNIALLREQFPLHAQMWYGDAPSEEDLQEAKDRVTAARVEIKEAEKAHTEAQADLEVAQQEIDDEADAEPEVGDYDEDNDPEVREAIKAQAEKIKTAVVKKREREAADAKLSEEQRAKKAREAERRKDQAKRNRQEKKDREAEYPELVKYKEGYKRLKREKLENQQTMTEYAERHQKLKASATKAHETTRHERDMFMSWLNSTADKPEGWDAKRQFGNFQRFMKAKTAERDNDKKLPTGKVARKSQPAALRNTATAAKSTGRAAASAASAAAESSDEE